MLSSKIILSRVSSSIGGAAVSKTAGCRFDPYLTCLVESASSSMVERHSYIVEVVGSSPTSLTEVKMTVGSES